MSLANASFFQILGGFGPVQGCWRVVAAPTGGDSAVRSAEPLEAAPRPVLPYRRAALSRHRQARPAQGARSPPNGAQSRAETRGAEHCHRIPGIYFWCLRFLPVRRRRALRAKPRSSLSSKARPRLALPRAARVRKRVSASNCASVMLAHSSTSLFRLTPLRCASSRSRRCFSSGSRIVIVAIVFFSILS